MRSVRIGPDDHVSRLRIRLEHLRVADRFGAQTRALALTVQLYSLSLCELTLLHFELSRDIQQPELNTLARHDLMQVSEMIAEHDDRRRIGDTSVRTQFLLEENRGHWGYVLMREAV